MQAINQRGPLESTAECLETRLATGPDALQRVALSEFQLNESDVIHRYTREQAIADGVLVDVSEVAKEAGFRVAVAMTIGAWVDCVQWTEETERRKPAGQDEAGRLWDVLYMAGVAARRNPGAGRLDFSLYRVPVEGKGLRPRLVTLRLMVGPGDDSGPVLTICLPNED